MAEIIKINLRKLCTCIGLILQLSLLACAPAEVNQNDHTHFYDGGQLSAYINQEQCILLLNGEINSDLERLIGLALAELSAKQCKQKIVLLQSHGGDVHSAMQIGRLLRKNQIITHINEVCDSACGLVFIGGSQRTVSLAASYKDGSRIGIHQVKSFSGLRHCLATREVNPLLLGEIKSYLRTMLPKEGADFYYRALMTAPCVGMEYLSADFLLKKGIATSVE
jgi:hypothetical protein